jgi:hypothetical protein
MAKRGRPRKDGLQPAWMFYRRLFMISSYNDARARGVKHSSAVTEAVEAVKEKLPDMPISVTEVRRILAAEQPKGGEIALKVTKVSDDSQPLPQQVCEMMGIHRGPRKNRLVFGYGPRPSYPRSNAKNRGERSSSTES